MTDTTKPSGLDMRDTLRFYESVQLPQVQEAYFPFPRESADLIGLSAGELGGLYALFPTQAQERSILRKVVGTPATWFRHDATARNLQITTEESQALSPTAIVPSYISYAWAQEGLTAAIHLYTIKSSAASERVKKIVLSEGFVHELGHSIIQPALSLPEYVLRWPDGTSSTGMDAVITFAELAEPHAPISHYASTYRGPDNMFASQEANYDPLKSISEEMCETIAAYFLGFAYCSDGARAQDPFADRPEVKAFVEDFLRAERVWEE